MEFGDLKGMFGEVKTRMDGAIERVRREMAGVRTGRAAVSLLDGVQVEAYGSRVPLNQVATLSVPEPAMIVAQPFDPALLKAIEKGITASDQAAASFDQDQSFVLVEIAGEQLTFRAISRTGQLIDSGAIRQPGT